MHRHSFKKIWFLIAPLHVRFCLVVSLVLTAWIGACFYFHYTIVSIDQTVHEEPYNLSRQLKGRLTKRLERIAQIYELHIDQISLQKSKHNKISVYLKLHGQHQDNVITLVRDISQQFLGVMKPIRVASEKTHDSTHPVKARIWFEIPSFYLQQLSLW